MREIDNTTRIVYKTDPTIKKIKDFISKNFPEYCGRDVLIADAAIEIMQRAKNSEVKSGSSIP